MQPASRTPAPFPTDRYHPSESERGACSSATGRVAGSPNAGALSGNPASAALSFNEQRHDERHRDLVTDFAAESFKAEMAERRARGETPSVDEVVEAWNRAVADAMGNEVPVASSGRASLRSWEIAVLAFVVACCWVLIAAGTANAYGWGYGLDLFWWIRR